MECCEAFLILLPRLILTPLLNTMLEIQGSHKGDHSVAGSMRKFTKVTKMEGDSLGRAGHLPVDVRPHPQKQCCGLKRLSQPGVPALPSVEHLCS